MNDKKEHCHYSGLPSPSAYAKDNIDYDGMGNQGRVPSIKESDRKDSIIIFLCCALVLFTALLIYFIYEYVLFN